MQVGGNGSIRPRRGVREGELGGAQVPRLFHQDVGKLEIPMCAKLERLHLFQSAKHRTAEVFESLR